MTISTAIMAFDLPLLGAILGVYSATLFMSGPLSAYLDHVSFFPTSSASLLLAFGAVLSWALVISHGGGNGTRTLARCSSDSQTLQARALLRSWVQSRTR